MGIDRQYTSEPGQATLIVMANLARLSTADLTNLAVEAADTPMNQAVLAVVDRAGVVDSAGRVDIARLRRHIEARLSRLPELRRVVHKPAFSLGRPLWTDDPDFRIEDHVRLVELPHPGGERTALDFTERQMAIPMDRSRPLWDIWFLDGYSSDGVGLLIKLHHALADGAAMVNLLAQILDIEPRPFEELQEAWRPSPRPSAGALLTDNVRRKAGWWRHAFGRGSHPWVLVRTAAGTLAAAVASFRSGRHAPRLFFNRPIAGARRISSFHASLEDAKAIAHRHGVKLNDVFLCLAASALRRTVLDHHQSPDGVAVHVSVAVSSARTDTTGNHAGTILVSVPIDIDDPRDLLMAVAAATARAKARQQAVVSTGLMAFLAQSGITRLYIRHQHLVNVLTTNLPGPPVALYLAGARVRLPIALPPIAGNVSISFAALSYERELCFGVIADARTWPDLGPVHDAMKAAWEALSESVAPPAVLSRAV